MEQALAGKLLHLADWFKQHERVTVAYSGGVDSALLLYLGAQILGKEKCTGFFADSCLISQGARASSMAFADEYKLSVQQVKLDPFVYPLFAENLVERCYICKKNTYQAFFKILESPAILVDGTNLDDLSKHRPGLRALTELGVATPFLDCKITKYDIRSLSYHLGLSTWGKLSESCLATRVKPGLFILKSELQRIGEIEKELHLLGLEGCRVQLRDPELLVTVHTGQLKQILDNDMIQHVKDVGQRYQFAKVFLDLFEREGILPSLLDYIGFVGNIAPSKQLLSSFTDMSG